MRSTAGLQPLAAADLGEKAAETLARVRELFGAEPIPEPFFVYARNPAFLHDFYMNLKRFVLTPGKLQLKSKLLIAYCAAVVLDCRTWRDVFAARLESVGATEAEIAGAASVAATCAMYNVLFKFRDMAGSDAFRGMPVCLRGFALAGSGLDEKTVETINVAVSDLNGCKPCTAGHVARALEIGVSEEALYEAVQAAAAVASGAVFLRAASSMASGTA